MMTCRSRGPSPALVYVLLDAYSRSEELHGYDIKKRAGTRLAAIMNLAGEVR